MITSNIEVILIVTGALTAAMVVQFFAPSWMLRHTYGEAPSGPISIALARHWGLLLFCVGALLVYSAFHPALRAPALVLASVEKAGLRPTSSIDALLQGALPHAAVRSEGWK